MAGHVQMSEMMKQSRDSELSKIRNCIKSCRRTNIIVKIGLCQCELVIPGPEIILKTFSCSTELSMKFSLLINVKMPTIVGILTFIIIVSILTFMSWINE